MSQPISQNERQKKPWKFEGYPSFSKWMASSEDFLILRRFGELNVRAMLLMQDRIVRKEEMLLQIDEDARRGTDDMGDSSSLRYDPRKDREKVLDDLIIMLQQYSRSGCHAVMITLMVEDDYLVSYSQIKGWKSAQKYQVANVENWFWNHPRAIVDEEQEFVRRGDVTALVGRVKSPLRLLLEKFQSLLTSRLFKVKLRTNHVPSATTSYYSNARFDAFVTAVLIVLGLLLLLGPMWILQFVTDDVKRLGIITGFILLFTSLLASATVAKPFEVLAAVAAYSAVLMVFLQN